MDDIGLKLCYFQAQLFEESKDYFSCSSSFFIKNYMNSPLATRLDNKTFILEARDIKNCFNELNINNNIIYKKTDHYPSFILSWIGYLYRYACYEYHLSSTKIYNIIKPKELYNLYEAYHSLDVNEALKRITEAKNIDLNNIDNVDYLAIAKRIYNLD